MIRYSPLLVVVGSSLLGGCNVAARVATEVAVKQLTSSKGASAPTTQGDTAYINALTPSNSGEGLIVYEPVADASVARWADLGAGASRYLHVHVAGQPELGKTPLWGQVDDMRRQAKFSNLRLDAKQALLAGAPTGATRVAVGQLSGSDASLKLTYQLLDVKTGKVLSTVSCTTPPTQIPAQLPILARQMCAKLNIPRPTLPTQLTLSSADLAFLGGQRWKKRHGQNTSAGDKAKLIQLAPKDAIAGVLAQRLCHFGGGANWSKGAAELLTNAPNNALVAGEIGWTGASRWVKRQAQLDALSRKYPNNFLLCTAKEKVAEEKGQTRFQVQMAEKAAKASPRNALAWIELSDAQSDEAQALRDSRYSNSISQSEWKILDGIYPRSQAAAIKATQVDPQNSYSWSELALAATFNSDGVTAQKALWKAIQLDPANDEAYNWGFQMCQPKWYGDAAAVLKVVTVAVANADKANLNARSLVEAMEKTNQKPALPGFLQTIIKKDPNNTGAMNQLAMIYHYQQQNYAPAEKLYRQVLKLDPHNGRAQTSLGDILYFAKNDRKGAEKLYRGAIADEPEDGYFHANLGRCLAQTGRMPEAVKEAKLAKSLGYTQSVHPVWGETGVQP